jgi:multimeric flavodoxin WrbA
MKTLILNGSPRKNGDTSFLLSILKEELNHEVAEISAYFDGIKPCVDCRACQKSKGCAIDDKMRLIYDDDFDNVVIASPIYISNLTPPLFDIASRFQAYYCAKRFLKDGFAPKKKKAAMILVGGGDGSALEAIRLSNWIFKNLNASGHEEHTAVSLKTDSIPAHKDAEAIEKVKAIARYFNGGANA